MSSGLRIVLIIFALLWFILVSFLLKKNKLPIKYSIFWYIFIVVLFLLSAFPDILVLISEFFGFKSISNLVIGIILTLLLIITLLITIIVSDQKKNLRLLNQEVSLLKSKIDKDK